MHDEKNEENNDRKEGRMRFNRRRFFRISLDDNERDCQIVFLDFGDEKFKHLVNKRISAKVMDLSVGGMRISTEYDLPVQYHIVSIISFEINDERFYLQCEFQRKEAKKENENIVYGVRFINVDKNIESKLGKIIHQLEVQKHKIGLHIFGEKKKSIMIFAMRIINYLRKVLGCTSL